VPSTPTVVPPTPSTPVSPNPTLENTSFETAILVTAETVIPVPVTEANQRRYYYFVPTETGRYIISSSSDTAVDPYGYIYNENRSTIANNDDAPGTNDFSITYNFTAGTRYYIVARCYGTTTGNYTFTITPPNPSPITPSTTPVPNNTTFETAIPAILGTEIPVNVTAAGQIHYYTFTPPSTGRYIFESANNGNSDPYAYLYNENRSHLANNDDSAGNHNFYIAYNLTYGQTYYIGAKCYASTTGSYYFRIYQPVTP
jgi:hypothetical protein